MVMTPPVGPGTDAVLEYAARLIEDMHFSDLAGIHAKRKRDREDAAVRVAAIEATRKECARHIRAFKARRDLDVETILKRIAALKPGRRHDAELREAWPLAWKGLVKIEATISVACNSVPPDTHYTISLTDKGRTLIAEKITS